MAKPALLKKPLNNRIVGHGEEVVEQMLANPANFRLHPDTQQQALAGSIDEIGYIHPVLINKTTGHVIDGHLRIEIAQRSGVKTLPVSYVELTEEEERLALLSLDPIAAMAAADKEQLDALLRNVHSDDERVQKMLEDLAEQEGLTPHPKRDTEPEPQIDKAAELQEKWQVEAGQIWQLGEHRLMCGDSTDPEQVALLLDGKQYQAVVTSPPYFLERSYEHEFTPADGKKTNRRCRKGLV